MPKTFKKPGTADKIVGMACRGQDISAYFANKFTVVRPVRPVHVDLTRGMRRDLYERGTQLKIRR